MDIVCSSMENYSRDRLSEILRMNSLTFAQSFFIDFTKSNFFEEETRRHLPFVLSREIQDAWPIKYKKVQSTAIHDDSISSNG